MAAQRLKVDDVILYTPERKGAEQVMAVVLSNDGKTLVLQFVRDRSVQTVGHEHIYELHARIPARKQARLSEEIGVSPVNGEEADGNVDLKQVEYEHIQHLVASQLGSLTETLPRHEVQKASIKKLVQVAMQQLETYRAQFRAPDWNSHQTQTQFVNFVRFECYAIEREIFKAHPVSKEYQFAIENALKSIEHIVFLRAFNITEVKSMNFISELHRLQFMVQCAARILVPSDTFILVLDDTEDAIIEYNLSQSRAEWLKTHKLRVYALIHKAMPDYTEALRVIGADWKRVCEVHKVMEMMFASVA